MLMTRLSSPRTTLIALASVLGILGSAPASAQPTGLETAALAGGRIIGAAKACGINAERIRRASDRLLFVVDSKAASASEKKNSLDYFVSGQIAGAEQARAERALCSSIHVDFSEIEVKLGRSADTQVAAKRGVSALGALGTQTGTVRQ